MRKSRFIIIISRFLDGKFDIMCGETALESHYPGDIAYNIARVGRFVIHNFKYTDSVIKIYISDNNLVCVNVSQRVRKMQRLRCRRKTR
ncbi:MAG: hypothetical protein L6V93_16145 [Clostridiales bacterium]|nr:MAG: hypothetical protein L6V93_16145 [Clostridiales bacterium]